eukprot:8480973-Alexandrium_andersonii.AAC.1
MRARQIEPWEHIAPAGPRLQASPDLDVALPALSACTSKMKSARAGVAAYERWGGKQVEELS